MNKLKFDKYFRSLNVIERKGYKYLFNKNIRVKIQNNGRYGIPDFETEEGKFYEIKTAIATVSPVNVAIIWWTISFTKYQVKRFEDEYNILIFFPNENEPKFNVTFGQIKKYLNKGGVISLNKLLTEKERELLKCAVLDKNKEEICYDLKIVKKIGNGGHIIMTKNDIGKKFYITKESNINNYNLTELLDKKEIEKIKDFINQISHQKPMNFIDKLWIDTIKGYNINFNFEIVTFDQLSALVMLLDKVKDKELYKKLEKLESNYR